MVYDWIFASTRFALETKWNCGDNDLYLYVILILNDLAMLWFDSYKYMVYVDNHMLWNFDWDSCKHMIHIENYMFVVVIYNTHLIIASIWFMFKVTTICCNSLFEIHASIWFMLTTTCCGILIGIHASIWFILKTTCLW